MDCAGKNRDENAKHAVSTSGRSPLSRFFERVDNIDSLSPDDFIDRFERYGFLWFKAKGSKSAAKIPTGNQILDFVKEHSSACEKSWTIENHSKDTARTSSTSPPTITPQKLHDFTGTDTSFYVSTIVHRQPQEGQSEQNDYNDNEEDRNRKPSSEILPSSNSSPSHQSLMAMLPKFDNVFEEEDRNRKPSSEILPPSNSSPSHQSLMAMLPKFDNVFEDIYENGDPSGTWLFLGHHGISAAPTMTKSSANKKTKKQKLRHDRIHNDETTTTLIGRAEHVDEVTHSGTYHIQVSGTKTWKIRPHPDSFLAEEFMLNSEEGSRLRDLPGAEQEGSGGKSDKCWIIRINVEEGDVFVLNTKVWYHCTELNFAPNSASSLPSSEWSISVAQDFYLPVPCPKDVKKGDIVYGYDDEIDEDEESDESRADREIPDELPRSDNPNCVLVEIGVNECDDEIEDDNDDEISAGTKIALVALRDIIEGESLTIAFDLQDDQLGNANEQMDPRVISRQYWKKNQIVVRGEDRMPQDIPRSYDPNCELVEINSTDTSGGACLALRALVDIPEGGVFCIFPDEDEEYEEVEVDLGTGELLQ
jgi:hypothetical protein